MAKEEIEEDSNPIHSSCRKTKLNETPNNKLNKGIE
jgi:hypothetical protein